MYSFLGPGDEVIEAPRFAGLQHLHRDFGQVDVDAVLQDFHLPADVERRLEQHAIVGEVHEAVGDVVVDDAADRPQSKQRPEEPAEHLLAQRLLLAPHVSARPSVQPFGSFSSR